VAVLAGLISAGTRALWLGTVLGVVVLGALAQGSYRLLLAVGVLVALLLASAIVPGMFQSVVSRVGSVTDTSEFGNALRLKQIDVLLDMSREHPFIGNGFGTIAPDITLHPDKPYIFEMETVAFYMKMGAIGCLLWVAFFGWLLFTLAKISRVLTNPLRAMIARALCGGCVGILFAGSTNPWLSLAVGMGACTFIVVVRDLLHVQSRSRFQMAA
jgi:O-antigen ligase